MKKRTAVVTRVALMLALSMILSYLEHLLNLNVGVPGVKLGTANIVCLYALYRFTVYEALGVHLGRIILAGILFGNPVSLAYSVTGGLLAFVTMLALKRTKLFSAVGVSICGSLMHSVGQIIAASVLMGSAAVFTYLPFMMIWSLVFGAVTGGICLAVLKRTKNSKKSIDKGV